jgi:hypothetical protein
MERGGGWGTTTPRYLSQRLTDTPKAKRVKLITDTPKAKRVKLITNTPKAKRVKLITNTPKTKRAKPNSYTPNSYTPNSYTPSIPLTTTNPLPGFYKNATP